MRHMLARPPAPRKLPAVSAQTMILAGFGMISTLCGHQQGASWTHNDEPAPVRAGRLEYNARGLAGRSPRTNRRCVAGTDQAVQEVLSWRPRASTFRM